MHELYIGDMTFHVPLDDQRRDGWTRDRNGKMDYDPATVRLSSRTHPDGSYSCSVYLGEDQLVGTGLCRAPDQTQAMNAVEVWSSAKVAVIASVIRAVFGRRDETALDAAARMITATIAAHDEGLAGTIDSKLLARQVLSVLGLAVPELGA